MQPLPTQGVDSCSMRCLQVRNRPQGARCWLRRLPRGSGGLRIARFINQGGSE